MLDFEFLADLPSPPDGEPPSLRDDIVDELADHLQCALRRELLITADAPLAESRVLDRFGDPRKLARRLWRQAIWSRMMKQRIVSGLQWGMTIAALALAGFVVWQQSALLQELKTARAEQQAERQAMSNVLNRLVQDQATDQATIPGQQFATPPEQRVPEILPGSADPGPNLPGMGRYVPSPVVEPSDVPAAISLVDPHPESLKVVLVQETADGPPMLGAKCVLSGSTKSIELREQSYPPSFPLPSPAYASPGENPRLEVLEIVRGNTFTFHALTPDHYSLEITLKDGQQCTQHVLVRDDKPQWLKVVCPTAGEKAPVLITVTPLPEDLRTPHTQVWCQLLRLPRELDHRKWRQMDDRAQESRRIVFEPGGRPQFVDNTEFPPDAPLENRVAFMPHGLFRARLYIYQAGEVMNDYWDESEWRNLPGDEMIRTVNAGENHWQLELPDELIAAARKTIANRSSNASTATIPAPRAALGASSVDHGSRDVSPAVSTNRRANLCRVVVKLTSETKDGPLPKGAGVWLIGEQGIIDPDATPEVVPHYPEPLPVRTQNEPWAWSQLEPGRYKLQVKTADDCVMNFKLPLLRPGQERIEHVVCPPPISKTMLLVTTPPVPEDLRKAGVEVHGQLHRMDVELDGRNWTLPQKSHTDLKFDLETGLVEQADEVDLRAEAAEDRLLFLPAGPYRQSLTYSRTIERAGSVENLSIRFPPIDQQPNNQPHFVAKSSENKWEIKIPDNFWDAARERLEIGAGASVNP